jgi:LysR family glycine cleavage system transcriptional activator
MIANATEELLKDSSQDALRLLTYTTFAAKWLIPRLPDFHAKHPGIEVRLSTAVPDVDFDRDEVDMAIQFGDGQWPNTQADRLFTDQTEPVCSPAFLAMHAPESQHPESLLRQRLLLSRYRRNDWSDWLEVNQLSSMSVDSKRMSFGSSILALQAAIDGLGIVIGQTRLLASDFETGRLLRPFAGTRWKPLRSDRAYYLLRPLHQRESNKTWAFREWLLQTVKELPPLQD